MRGRFRGHRAGGPARRGLPARAVAAAIAVAAVTMPAWAANGSTAVAREGAGWVAVRTHGARVLVRPHGRFGIFPTRESRRTGAPGTRPAGGAWPAAITAQQLAYGGGVDGIGVTTGSPRVYLVYWGSQWGTATTGADGYVHLSGDRDGMAPDQQAFFAGLGTGGETWSGVMTQYCEGVAAGATTCPATATHVGYPAGGALAGVWVDSAAAAPASAGQAQIAAEAVRAAEHFGNTTAASNRDAQYVVTSPPGAHPDGFPDAGFCAWHDFTGSVDGDLAYTNMPYVPDAGAGCGANFVNAGAAGALDGVTIVGGHEYAETITDQNPPGGWLDGSGGENGDKCAWISSGQGASQDVALSTGSFAVQSTWANDFDGGAGGCEIAHPIVGGSSPSFKLSASPTMFAVLVGTSGSTLVTSTISGGFDAPVGLSASGLPAGATASFSPNPLPAPGSGTSALTVDVGAATPPGTYKVKVTGKGGGQTHVKSISLSVVTIGQNLIGNPGFENGTTPSPWSASAGVIDDGTAEPPHTGSWDAWLGGDGTSHTDHLYQQVALPSAASGVKLSLWLHIDTADAGTTIHDRLRVQIKSTSGKVLKTLGTYSNLNARSGYTKHTYSASLLPFIGQTVRLYLTAVEDGSLQTSFVVDDFSLTVS